MRSKVSCQNGFLKTVQDEGFSNLIHVSVGDILQKCRWSTKFFQEIVFYHLVSCFPYI